MIIVREDVPHGVLAVEGVGQISRSDYQDILIPELERAFAHGDKVRFLYHLGDEFQGFAPGALLDDMKVGLKHLGDFQRIAVVCDKKWVQQAVRLIGFLTPCPIKTFSLDESETAFIWLTKD